MLYKIILLPLCIKYFILNFVLHIMSDLVLTKGQNSAFRAFKNFIKDNNSKVFILKGYAGTGKTTLMKIFIEEMEKQNINYRLLASTGCISHQTTHTGKLPKF